MGFPSLPSLHFLLGASRPFSHAPLHPSNRSDPHPTSRPAYVKRGAIEGGRGGPHIADLLHAPLDGHVPLPLLHLHLQPPRMSGCCPTKGAEEGREGLPSP